METIGSIKDRTSFYLALARLVFPAGDSFVLLVFIEPVHLPLGVDFVADAGGQSAKRGSADKFTSPLGGSREDK
jgi:hypothetical protein